MRAKDKWNKTIDLYVDGLEIFSFQLNALRRQVFGKIEKFGVHSRIVSTESNLLFKLTFIALTIVFATVLFSCQTRPVIRGRPPGAAIRKPDKGYDPLYIKRDSLNLKPVDPGSRTGSMWADATQPRQFFNELKPSKTGEVLSVSIPKELQFQIPNVGAAQRESAPRDKGKSDKGAAKNAANVAATGAQAQGNSDGEIKNTDPFAAGQAGALAYDPLSSLKMQIIAMDQSGDVFLRGFKDFNTNMGEKRSVMILAKLPKRALMGYEIDARELTEIEVSDEIGGQTTSYRASGWDVATSRRLSGFTPDINYELMALDEVRGELAQQQKSIRDQRNAIVTEQERIKKERERGAAVDQRDKSLLAAQNTAGPASGTNPATPNAQAVPPKSGASR